MSTPTSAHTPDLTAEMADAERIVPPTLGRLVLAEGIGTALLLIAVVGSGIMAATRSPLDEGLQLLEAALATGMGLAAIIMAIGPVSGAHLNPAVTLADQLLHPDGWRRPGAWTRTGSFVLAQLAGGAVGVMIANAMFDLDAVTFGTTRRTGAGQWLGEAVATYGLVLVIFLMVRARASVPAIAVAVGAIVAGAHWFTSSTSFANPAVTFSRMLTDTFAGIAPGDVLPFVAVQLLAALAAVGTVALLRPAD